MWLGQYQNICTTKQYACCDIKSWSECGYLDGFDCVWQTSTELCIDFTCTGVDQVNYNPFRCSYVNGKCGDPQEVDGYHLTATSCYWNYNVCQEATDANLIQYNAQNCVTKSVGHYQWDSETSKCKQCQSLTANPLYSTLNKVITSEKNSIAIWTLISYFIFLN